MKKIAVLCSGGVDSSVALSLLKEQGYDITVFYLKIWLEDELSYLGSCPWEEDVSYIKKTCSMLGVSFEQVPLQKEYWNLVVNQSIQLIKNGYTPNPDVFCNQMIKFGCFNTQYGGNFEHIATGHYAAKHNENNWQYLKMMDDEIKDQTYFLAYTSYEQLKKVIFPLQIFKNKAEVRSYAIEKNLPAAMRKDSQGICFLGKLSFFDFIKHHCGEKEGLLINYETLKIEGKHKGFWFFTIGQRQGIGLSGGPWYVITKNHIENIVYISKKSPEEFFHSNEIKIKINALNYLVPENEYLKIGHTYLVKLRHGKQLNTVKVIAIYNKHSILVVLQNEDQGIASGQCMVFYDSFKKCIGAGIMEIEMI
jgi:tRNA (5-methylaminomethyl-2-thiouridylate)-methyltransferase